MNLLHAPEKVWQSQNVPLLKQMCWKITETYISKQGLLFCFIEMVDDFLIILKIKKVQNIKHWKWKEGEWGILQYHKSLKYIKGSLTILFLNCKKSFKCSYKWFIQNKSFVFIIKQICLRTWKYCSSDSFLFGSSLLFIFFKAGLNDPSKTHTFSENVQQTLSGYSA